MFHRCIHLARFFGRPQRVNIRDGICTISRVHCVDVVEPMPVVSPACGFVDGAIHTKKLKAIIPVACMSDDFIDERNRQLRDRAHRAGKCRTIEADAITSLDLRLSIVRQVVPVFQDQYMS
jgi:hypothetical protein